MMAVEHTAELHELWDYESGNLLADFISRADALTTVRDGVQQHGRDYVAIWRLGRTDDAGLNERLLEGHILTDEALKPVSA